MLYIKNFHSLEKAIGTTALTPFVGMVKGTHRVVYADTDTYGDRINLVTDGSDYFMAEKPVNVTLFTLDEEFTTVSNVQEVTIPITTSIDMEYNQYYTCIVWDPTKVILHVTYTDHAHDEEVFDSYASTNCTYITSTLAEEITILAPYVGQIIMLIESSSITISSLYAETTKRDTSNLNANGYEYVDLGLPSGTLWATCNVGASNEYDFGNFYQWADTSGHEESAGSTTLGYNYQWSNTPYCTNTSNVGNASSWSKYNTLSAKLEASDDAAAVNLGGDWLMPTKDQLGELYNFTIREYNVESNGVKGHKFTSFADSSKYIFIPYAGYCYDSSHNRVGSGAYLWSRELSSDYINNAWRLYLSSDGYYDLYYSLRYYGFSVRGVL